VGLPVLQSVVALALVQLFFGAGLGKILPCC
jgi:hypothetical protein